VGTAKRERQKANKALREQELARKAARSRSTRIGALVIAAIVAVFVLVLIAGRFIDDDDSESLAPSFDRISVIDAADLTR